jgi:hypothetical protein
MGKWNLRITESFNGMDEAYTREDPLNVDYVIFKDSFNSPYHGSGRLTHYVVYKLDKESKGYELVQRYTNLRSAKQRVYRDEKRARG